MKQLLFCLILTCFAACAMPARFVIFNKPSIKDGKIFPKDTIQKPDSAFHFKKGKNATLPPPSKWISEWQSGSYASLEDFLKKSKTVAFLVIQNDSILYEHYTNGGNEAHPFVVFSITKAFVTALAGIAIEEGDLNLNDAVADYYPPYTDKGVCANIQIQHLLQMNSGLNHDDYHTFGKLAHIYYTNKMDRVFKNATLSHTPGKHFAYKSIDTQLLGWCLEEATGMRVAEYLQAKLWQPLGMEYDAYFTLDRKNGLARTFGGMMICSRDIAKLGKLYLQNGKWKGEQIVPQQWVEQCRTRPLDGSNWWGYNTGWWLDTYTDRNVGDLKDAYAAGFGGQYLYINPEANLLIVRQGHSKASIKWENIFGRLANELQAPLATQEAEYGDYVHEFSGIYKNKAGQQVSIEQAGENWKVDCMGTTYTMQQECPQSLSNLKKERRILFEIVQDTVQGIYLDDIRTLVFFKKKVR